MGSSKQIKEPKGKASPKSKNAASNAPEKSVAVDAKKTSAPKPTKSASEKAKAEIVKSSHATMKAQIKKDSKTFQKTAAKNGVKKTSEKDSSSESTPAVAKTEVKAGKKRNIASLKAEKAVDSSDEENEENSESDLDSEDEKEILNKLDLEPKVNKPEKESSFTGITYDTKTNDLSISIQEKLAQRSHKADDPVGVIYVGRLPSGFEEYELGVFFGQFGEIKKLRLSRNRRTGNSRHYAFIQYSSLEVAKIVAEAVNNYLVYGRLLKCQVVPEEKVHFKMFWGASPTLEPFVKIERKVRTLPKTPEQIESNFRRNSNKKNKLAQKLQELGIDYDVFDFSQKTKSDGSNSNTPKTTRQKA